MNKIEKIKTEIEFRIAQWSQYTFACASQIASEAIDRVDELKGLLAFIDSLQDEPNPTDIVKQYVEKGERCMEESDEKEYPFWDGFHNCAQNILREIESAKDEQDNLSKGWISVKDALPPIDKEVIVLSDYINGRYVKNAHKISFGHRPDSNGWDGKSIVTGEVKHYEAVTYAGWNIPGVTHWIPCPPVPGEDERRYIKSTTI